MRRPRYLKDVRCFYEQVRDPRTGNMRVVQVVDAVEEFTYYLDRQDVWGSKSKAGTEGYLSKCIQDNGAGRVRGVYATQTTNSLMKIIFTDNIDVAYKYELPDDGKKVAKINDDIKKGKKELLALMPMIITLRPPRRNHSIEFLQSEEMKEMRAASRERRRGESPRAYATPTESGFRDARRWTARKAKR